MAKEKKNENFGHWGWLNQWPLGVGRSPLRAKTLIIFLFFYFFFLIFLETFGPWGWLNHSQKSKSSLFFFLGNS
jgi:hypothetical protein